MALAMPAETEITKERSALEAQAGALTIASQPDYTRAAGLLTSIKAMLGKIAETFDPIVEAAHKAHKIAVAKREEHAKPLKTAEQHIKSKMSAYLAIEERRTREESARLAAEARKADEDSRLAEAAALEAAGETEAAERVLDAPPAPPPPMVISAPKADGVSFREVWHGEVLDLQALVEAVATGKAPLAFIEPAHSLVTQWARSTRGSVQMPGVRVWSTKEIAARAR